MYMYVDPSIRKRMLGLGAFAFSFLKCFVFCFCLGVGGRPLLLSTLALVFPKIYIMGRAPPNPPPSHFPKYDEMNLLLNPILPP